MEQQQQDPKTNASWRSHFPQGLVLKGKKKNVELSKPLIFGTYSWGDKSTWGWEGYDSQYLNENTVKEAFQAAISNQIYAFDTDESFAAGKAEQLLGGCVKQLENGPHIVVIDKFVPFTWRISKKSLKSAVTESLFRLGLKSFDLYLIHSPLSSLRSIDTWVESLAECVEEGIVKTVGVSNFSAAQVKKTHEALAKFGIPLAVNQVEFSLLRSNPEESGLLQTCKELGILVMGYCPLGMGRLTGKYSKDNPPQGNRKYSNFPMDQVEPLLEKLRDVGSRHGKTPAQVAINWCICKGVIPVVGVKNAQQVIENCGCLGWELFSEEVAELDKLTKRGHSDLITQLWQE
jgi:aryl-alcohol dehydrogenase-like predicted oxidoreductase